MTDVSHPHDLSPHGLATPSADRAGKTVAVSPLMPYVVVFAAGAGGLALSRAIGGDAGAFDSKLLLLLRFMAVMKFAGVVAAAAVTHWRLTQAVAARLAFGYLAALLPMAAAPGLIWGLGGIGLGALLFHAGLLAFLVLAWKDDGARLPIGPRRG